MTGVGGGTLHRSGDRYPLAQGDVAASGRLRSHGGRVEVAAPASHAPGSRSEPPCA